MISVAFFSTSAENRKASSITFILLLLLLAGLKTLSFFCWPGLTRNIIRLPFLFLPVGKLISLLAARLGLTQWKNHLSFAGPDPALADL